MEAFVALGIAANIAQFVDYGARFVKLAHDIRNGTLDETGLVDIEQYVSNISFIRSTLEVKVKALGSDSALQLSDEACSTKLALYHLPLLTSASRLCSL
jgi:hypothetical protein